MHQPRPILSISTKRNAVLDDPNVGASDTCMDCRNDLAAFTTGWQLCEQCRRTRIRIKQAQLAPYGEQQQPNLVDDLIELWTITEYVAWLNQPREGWVSFTLTDDLAHWAEIGVHKAKDLAVYLDACVAREIEKERGW